MNLIITAVTITLFVLIVRKLIYDIIILITDRNKIDLNVELCPICKSHKIKKVKNLKMNKAESKCLNCGYQGTMLEMNIKDAEKIKK